MFVATMQTLRNSLGQERQEAILYRHGRMGPMTSAERQALFRARHPHYYKERRRREKERQAARKAGRALAERVMKPVLMLPDLSVEQNR